MNLNERAAKCISWEQAEDGVWWSAAGPEGDWNPENDYNHARMLYARVVEMGMEDRIGWYAREKGWLTCHQSGHAGFCEALRLTAAQLTEACCKVLEQDKEGGDSN